MTSDKLHKFWAGGFLYNPRTGEVFLHQRDANTRFNPNMWAFFGGLSEPGENPVDCFLRELQEETGLVVPASQAQPLCDYLNVELDTYRYVFFVQTDVRKTDLQLGEGAGFDWIPLSTIDQFDLTEKTRRDLDYFREYLSMRD